METRARSGRLSALFGAVLLSACGGGGGGGGDAAPAPAPSQVAYPASGTYSYVLKANGSAQARRFGLSLVHAGSPGDEYEIEPVTAGVDVVLPVRAGTIDAGQGRATAIGIHAVVYIAGGDIRWLPLSADGTAPAARVKRASITTACAFTAVINDYADPDHSRYVVSTRGADDTCGTADDGALEMQAGPSGVFVTSPTTTLAFVRDPATYAPAARVLPEGLLWFGPGGALVAMGINGNTVQRVVGVAGSSALVEYGTSSTRQLYLADLRMGTHMGALDATLTAGSGWMLIGYDASSFYVYRTAGATWKILKISRDNPAATELASGTGTLTTAAMGVNVLYAGVTGAAGSIGGTGNQLLSLSKATPGTPTILESLDAASQSSVQASASGVHQRWRLSNVGLPGQTLTIEMRDESDTLLYTGSSGFIMGTLDPAAEDFGNSENATRFLFATNFGAGAFADAPLVVYDASARTATTLGNLPGAAQFPGSAVFAWVVGGPGDFVVGSAAVISSGNVQGGSTKVFSARAATPSSLTYSTAKF